MFSDNIYSVWSLSRIHTEWSAIVTQDYRLHDLGFRREAIHFAKCIMRKAREEFEHIASNLVNGGYRFASDDWPIKNPCPDVTSWVSELQHRNIHIPIVLEAWLTEVGSVNLMGSHPDWSKPGYLFDDVASHNDLLCTDAFTCELTREYIDYLYEEWESEDINTRMPFRIDFSPDHLHKANISGGLPYQMSVGSPSIDSIVLNERHCTSFMGLVRTALQWRGFPGFEYIGNEGIWSEKGLQIL